jgi:hypothetical protein
LRLLDYHQEGSSAAHQLSTHEAGKTGKLTRWNSGESK